MDVALLLLVLFLIPVACCCGLVMASGVDPLRLLRAALQAPKRRLARLSDSGSDGERSALLALDRHARRLSGRSLLHSDSISALGACATPREAEALLRTARLPRAVNSETKALQLAQVAGERLELPALAPELAASLIAALAGFAHLPPVARCVGACLRAQRGRACLELKAAVDDRVSLFDLLYRRVTDADEREAVLKHLEAEAAELRATPDFVAPVKLLCDIDDTMLAALFDRRYPDLTVYPGVHQFALELLKESARLTGGGDVPRERADRELDADADKKGELLPRRSRTPGRVAFLTARPEFLRKRSTQELHHCGFSHFTLLMGRLINFVGAERIAAGKLENFMRYQRMFAEHQFVFVGDNGQGDIDLGKQLLASPERFGVTSVLIHDVIRSHVRLPRGHAPLSRSQSYRWKECQQFGLRLFRTYIGASLELHQRGMLPLAAVVRVVEQTAAAYADVEFDSDAQRSACAREILSDVAVVIAALPSQQALALVTTLHDDLVSGHSGEETAASASEGTDGLARVDEIV